MRRYKHYWLIGLLLIFPSTGYTLNLGSIQLLSGLNEPLNAIIPLTGIQAGQLDTLRVQLASKEHFNKAGLNRPHLLQQLRFSTESPSATEQLIRVTTHNLLREPILIFLLEVDSGKERLIKEYILLLDPPGYQAAATQTAPPPVRIDSDDDSALSDSPAAVNSYGPVTRNDTLSEIASRIRPAPHLNIYQIMVALIRSNPHAFVRGNINNLKKNIILTVPETEVIEKIPKRQARRIFMDHASNIGLALAPRADMAPPKEPDQIPPPQAATTAPEPSGVLRLEEVGQQTAVTENISPAVITERADEVARLRVDYAALQSVLKQYQQAIQLLKIQLDEEMGEKDETIGVLTATAGKLREELAVRDRNIARLQAAIQENSAGAQTAPATDKSITLLDEIRWDTPSLLWLIAPLVIIGAFVRWLSKRREREIGQQLDVDPQPSREKEKGKTAESMPATPREESPVAPANTQQAAAERDALPSLEIVTAEPLHPESPPSSEEPEELPSNIDRIYKTLDVYLAYRHFSMFEQLLDSALKTHPDDIRLKAKRLDIYAFRQEKKLFFNELSNLESELDEKAPEYWKHILEWVQRFDPDHPLIVKKSALPEGEMKIV
ncbi:MAG: hypothetical protein L3J26_11585 [Candidatus Polarisedimenticolaceae bacterium]|nr:hypothetical protein [Candidatus Polarisedimenticolaceae bacterium]